MIKAFCRSTNMPQTTFLPSKAFLIFSVILIKARVVECLLQKTNCKLYRRSKISRNLYNQLKINFSMSFFRFDKRTCNLKGEALNLF